MATPEIVEHRGLTVVGVEFPDASEKPHLTPYVWATLAARIGDIPNLVDPHLLYGIWYRKPDAVRPSYLVGVEVSHVATLPRGVAPRVIIAGSFVRAIHRGDVARIGETYAAIKHWMRWKDVEPRDAATFEVYNTRQRITDEYEVAIHEPVT